MSKANLRVKAAGKVYDITITVPGDGVDPLPMLLNSALIRLCEDCPELMAVKSLTISAKTVNPKKKGKKS